MLLTRLPAHLLSRANANPAACIWAYPIVGATIGAIGAGVYALARVGLPPAMAAILAAAATILATGGLHEDGLADTADGFGGGHTRDRKLEIMRDSHIGSYGALALMVTLALRITAIAVIAEPYWAGLALVMAGALGRGAMLVPVLRLAPARTGGLATSLATRSPWMAVIGLGIAAIFALPAPIALLGAGVAAVGMTMLARRQVGGYTGDVLGATQQLAECAVLLILASVWG